MKIPFAASTNVFYSAWFCPYAQRTWAALNELRVPYQLIESLQIDPVDKTYIKNGDLLKYNPKGLVPTLVQIYRNKEGAVEEIAHCDSLRIMKELYIDAAQPGEELQVERVFEEAQHWNQRICSLFYEVLMRQDQNESREAWKTLTGHLMAFAEHLPSGKEFENGEPGFYRSSRDSTGRGHGEKPGMVDFTIFPFVHRLYVIEQFKGLTLPDHTKEERETKTRIVNWKERMERRPSVRETLADSKLLLRIYERYADGTAKSKVADAVRSGNAAHEV